MAIAALAVGIVLAAVLLVTLYSSRVFRSTSVLSGSDFILPAGHGVALSEAERCDEEARRRTALAIALVALPAIGTIVVSATPKFRTGEPARHH